MVCVVERAYSWERDASGAGGVWRRRSHGNARAAARGNQHSDGSAYADSDVGPGRSYANPCSRDTDAGSADSDADAFV